MNIDSMTDAEQKEYLDKLERTNNQRFMSACTVALAFLQNPANADLLGHMRRGLVAKAAIAVAEGYTLDRPTWQSLFGHGHEYAQHAA